MSAENSNVRFGVVFALIVLTVSVPFYTFGPGSFLPPSWGVRIPATALMTFVPVSTAMALSFAEKGWPAVGRLFAGVLAFRRIKPLWYAVCLLLAPAAALLSYLTLVALKTPLPGPTPVSTALLATPLLFVFGIGEEVGWTTYLTPRLQERWGALNAALFIGVVWALWHAIPYIDAGRSPGWIAAQSLMMLSLRTIMVWMYNNTGRAVLPAILLHVMTNVSYHMFPREGSHYDPVTFSAYTTAFALAVIWIWGPKTLADNRFRRGTSGSGPAARPVERRSA